VGASVFNCYLSRTDSGDRAAVTRLRGANGDFDALNSRWRWPDSAVTKVFIELRDTNYPGSTYMLTDDPQRDQLRGIYFQAVRQRRFNVHFVRMK